MPNNKTASTAFRLLERSKRLRFYEETIYCAQGGRFNIFEVLKIGHYEVRTHSPMLAELLNPQGLHGQGAKFLDLFIKQQKIEAFEAEGATVITEMGIGELGRLDIAIADRQNKRHIYIENKIGASLQFRQLERYQQHNANAEILFLTLYGEPPDATDIKQVPRLKLVSYQSDIIAWLECCRKEVATVPNLREAITQYIHLIQGLTQQNPSSIMNRELVNEIIKDQESYLAYAYLANSAQEIRKALVKKVNESAKIIEEGCDLIITDLLADDGKKGNGCLFTTKALQEVNLKFGFQFEDIQYRTNDVGFCFIEQAGAKSLRDSISKEFTKEFSDNQQASVGWPAYCPWTQYRNWDDATSSAIISGEFAENFKALITKLRDVGIAAIKNHQVASLPLAVDQA